MAKKMTTKTLLLVVLRIFAVFGQECDVVFSGTENTTCPEGLNEMFREEPFGQNLRLCCPPESDAEQAYFRIATNCRASKCVVSAQGDMCATLFPRYINGRKLEYEEVLREPCSRGEEREQGLVALCCQPNSKEGVMLTTLGAEHNEFPHQAKLVGCGGTIYNKRFLITAAHCVVKDGEISDTKGMTVFLGTNLGDINRMYVDIQELVYNVKRIIPHEGYNRLASNPKNELSWPPNMTRFYNDIALMELEKYITFSDKVKALEIAPVNFDPFAYADSAVVVGWGTTETLTEAMHLQKANFVLRKDGPCVEIESMKDMAEFQDSILCVGGVMDDKYSWVAGQGDSGGPAICRNADGHPVLCGVSSFASNDELCQNYTMNITCPPSGFTEVSYFREWIEEHAGEQDPSTFYQPHLYGQEVTTTKYPHQVHITSSNGKSCGGTLVRPDIVVTAAHCVVKADKSSLVALRVHVNVNNLGRGSKEILKVVDGRLLSGFEMEETETNYNEDGPIYYSDNYYKNDLAVIKLENNASVEENKLPKLPNYKDYYYRGVELAYPRNTNISGQLRSREFKLLDLAECQQRMQRISDHSGRNITLDKNMLCGVEKYSGGSTCDRELGGGLICKGAEGANVLCGVQIFRLCMLSIPNGFMDMRMYGKWVEEAITNMK